MHMSSLNIVSGATYRKTVKTVKRSDLKVGDLYQNREGGRTYMATGQRTMPPSGRTVSVVIGNQTVQHEVYKSLGRNAAGQDVIGYQSIVVKGAVKPGQDGAVVSFENGDVTLLGHAKVSLELFA